MSCDHDWQHWQCYCGEVEDIQCVKCYAMEGDIAEPMQSLDLLFPFMRTASWLHAIQQKPARCQECRGRLIQEIICNECRYG